MITVIKPICFCETLPRDNAFLSMESNAFVLSQREVKSMVSVRKDGWSGTTHIAIFSSYILTWLEHGMRYAIHQSLYDEINDWNWDSESRTLANGFLNIFVSFQHTIVSMLAKELLEPIRPIAECLQERLQEVYFGFQKVSEVKQHYQATREDVDKGHDRIYQKALLLTDKIGGEERMPRIIPGRQSRPNPEVQSPKDYWRVNVTIPFLDSIILSPRVGLGLRNESTTNCVH